jgi:SOS-response transcriptional repressor LexA
MKTGLDKRKLTRRQFEVLNYLVSFVLSHHYQPDLQNMADTFLCSKSAIQQQLVAIEKKGWICRILGQARAIDLQPEAVLLVTGKLEKDSWVLEGGSRPIGKDEGPNR